MKNSLRMMLPVALLALGTIAASADEFVVDGLRYETLSDNTVSVKKYVEGTDIVIPATVTDAATSKQYDVVAVGYQAFYGASGVKTVSIPASVKDLDAFAFSKCGAETVTIAEGLEKIGNSAFKGCSKLTTINLPSTLQVLGYVLPLTGADGNVFIDCTALKTIDIPGSVKHIGEMTFARCPKLETVTLHEGTVSFGERVFEECTALKSIEMPSTVTTWDRAIFNKTGLVSPVVPGTVEIIPNSAFLWCWDMTSFTIEEGVKEVGKQSFADCGKFTQVKVPNSVEWIRSDAFQGNGNVTEIYLGSGLRRLGHASLAVWVPDLATNTPQWALKEIHIASPVPPVHEQNDDHFEIVADDFFFGGKEFTDELRAQFYSEVKLYVPAAAVDEYKAADIWREFVNILPESKQDGIEGIAAESDLTIEGGIARAAGDIEVYTVSGVRVANAQAEFDLNTLGKGLYIVKSGNRSLKTIVK